MSSTYLPLSREWGQEPGQHKFVTASIFLTLLGAIGAISIGSGRITIIFLSIGSLGVCALILIIMKHIAPELLLSRLVLASYALQCFWLIFVASFDIGVTDETVLVPELYQHPFRGVLPNLLVPLAALATVGFWRMLPIRPVNRRDVWQLTKRAPTGLEIYLLIEAGLMLLSWPAAIGWDTTSGRGLDQEYTHLWGYAVRVVQQSFSFMPLVMGRYFLQFPRTNRLWLVVLPINAAIGLSVGGRGPALIPVGLYIIGRVLGQSGTNRLRSMIFATLLVIPISVLAGAVGVVRSDIGRGDFSLFSPDRVEEMADSIWSYLTNPSSSTDQDTLINGPGRMVVWPNLSATILTPEYIPYRGFDSFLPEVSMTFKIAAFAGLSRQDMYDANLSSYPATLYGYMVNPDTSVEWGVLADGWSRGGISGVLAFGFVLTLFFTWAEYIFVSRQVHTTNAILVAGILFGSALTFSATSTLLYILRQTTFACGLILLVAFVIEKLRLLFNVVPSSGPRAAVGQVNKRP